jgi:protein phosphatase
MAASPSGEGDASDFAVRFSAGTDPGTEKAHNEDSFGSYSDGAAHVFLAVADGVSGEAGGEVASRMAVDITLSTYRLSPAAWGPAKRLYRAAQQANIDIHDRALVVTELRRMSTTLTALVVETGVIYAAHTGDSRLYLIRGAAITQKTKDHTVAAGRRRMGLMSAERAKNHPERSTLTRSIGKELIAAVDRIAFPLEGGDVILVCSDGLYNVLDDEEMREVVAGKEADAACDELLRAANGRGTPDNLTVGVVQVVGTPPPQAPGWRDRFARMLGR